jgi:hemerythrin-like domain-containing protein
VTILEGLVAEHRVFLTVFDQIEQELPGLKSVEEIRLLCRLLGGLLHDHGVAETDLAYVALDHILKQRRQQTRLYHDHQEIDRMLKEVAEIAELPKARALLKAALEACRAHFDEEERNVFPLIERALQPETLAVLGRVWKPQPLASTPVASVHRGPVSGAV